MIEQLPALPMPEISGPRTLDGAAEILVAAGAPARAAVVLGTAMATAFPATVLKREPGHMKVRDAVVRDLGEETTAGLLAEGAALDIDEALHKTLSWLQEG